MNQKSNIVKFAINILCFTLCSSLLVTICNAGTTNRDLLRKLEDIEFELELSRAQRFQRDKLKEGGNITDEALQEIFVYVGTNSKRISYFIDPKSISKIKQDYLTFFSLISFSKEQRVGKTDKVRFMYHGLESLIGIDCSQSLKIDIQRFLPQSIAYYDANFNLIAEAMYSGSDISVSRYPFGEQIRNFVCTQIPKEY